MSEETITWQAWAILCITGCIVCGAAGYMVGQESGAAICSKRVDALGVSISRAEGKAEACLIMARGLSGFMDIGKKQ